MKKLFKIFIFALVALSLNASIVSAQTGVNGGPSPDIGRTDLSGRGEAKPAVIPCPDNLPCITEDTQNKGGYAVRDYILRDFGGRFTVGFLGIIGAASVVFLIVGGVQLHTAFGNEEGLNKGKRTITWAIAGLVIAIMSVIIVRIITNLPL